jgi:hypothetical protein
MLNKTDNKVTSTEVITINDLRDSDKFTGYRDEVFTIYGKPFPIPDYDLAAKYMLCQLQIFAGGNGLTDKSKIYINFI